MAIIGHLDLDAFFASVEEREKPWLKGLPVVVGADPHAGRGVVSTANYIARTYGIHSAMSITEAYARSLAAKKRGDAEVVFLVPHSNIYREASKEVFSIVSKYVPRIERVSVDEAYMDLSFTNSFEEARKISEKIRKEINKKTKLTASIGIGTNRMIAKIASDHKKPDGLIVVLPEEVIAFLDQKPIRAIPGVGKVAERKLTMQGVQVVGDMRALSWEELEEMFGSWGMSLYQKVHGIASDEIHTDEAIQKSIGEEETFSVDTLELSYVTTRLKSVVHGVLGHMKKKKVKGIRTVTLKIRFTDFETHTASFTRIEETSDARSIEGMALKLALPYLSKEKNPHQKPIRLIGISVSNITYQA